MRRLSQAARQGVRTRARGLLGDPGQAHQRLQQALGQDLHAEAAWPLLELLHEARPEDVAAVADACRGLAGKNGVLRIYPEVLYDTAAVAVFAAGGVAVPVQGSAWFQVAQGNADPVSGINKTAAWTGQKSTTVAARKALYLHRMTYLLFLRTRPDTGSATVAGGILSDVAQAIGASIAVNDNIVYPLPPLADLVTSPVVMPVGDFDAAGFASIGMLACCYWDFDEVIEVPAGATFRCPFSVDPLVGAAARDGAVVTARIRFEGVSDTGVTP